MTFLKWIPDEYRVRKRSTLHEYWRVLTKGVVDLWEVL
jgi:hypothetical protein